MMLKKKSQFIVYAGVSVKTCPAKWREFFHGLSDVFLVNDILSRCFPQQDIEFVNIATCNRYDICFFAKLSEQDVFSFFQSLVKECNLRKEFPTHLIENYLQIEFDNDALTRLFAVTASLDSLVLGEQQIFGQVKDAYQNCMSHGFARANAIQVFSHCFKVAKKVRHETDLGKHPVSVGHGAIDLAARIFHSFADKKILILGAGQMAKIICKHLLSRQANLITVANRSQARVENLIQDLNSNGHIVSKSLDEVLIHLYHFDICFIAAGGTDLLISRDSMANYYKKRQGNISVFVDISMPRKIHPDWNDLDNTFIFYVDDLTLVLEENKLKRQESAKLAEKFIQNEVLQFVKIRQQKSNLQNVALFHSWVSNMAQQEITKYLENINKKRNIDPSIVANAMAKKLVARCAQIAKNSSDVQASLPPVGDMLEFLFALSEKNSEFYRYGKKYKGKVVPFVSRKISTRKHSSHG